MRETFCTIFIYVKKTKHPSYNQLKVFLLHPGRVPSFLLYNIVI